MIDRVEVIRGLAMGGAETLLYLRLRSEIEEGLLQARKVVVINTASLYDHFVAPLENLGIKVISLDSGFLRGGLELAKRTRTCWPNATLVLHSPGASLLLKAARGLGCVSNALVEVVHSTRYRASYTVLGLLLNRFADVCVAVSGEVADARTSTGFPTKMVVHGGVDIAGMRRWVAECGSEGGRELRIALGIPADARLVVAVGSLLRLKGHADLVRAFAHVRDEIPDAHLLIVGAGPEMRNLLKLVEREGLSELVHLPGRLPDAWKALALADVQCHPSLFEGLPVALMEGAALGVPSVVTDIPGTRDFASWTPATKVTPVGDSVALGQALVSILHQAPAWDDDLASRGRNPTHWDISRYGREMNALIGRAGA